MRRVAAAAAWLVLPARTAGALETVVRAQLLGGQYVYAGQKAGLSGNAGLTVAPASRLTETVTLVGIVASSYQGTKQAVDLVGAGTLFQEQMEHRAAVRAVWEPAGSRWRVKPGLGYTYTLLKETRDENWGRGLFDSWRLGLGVDGEYPWSDGLLLKTGADYVVTVFPNFVSLESQAGLDSSGEPLARELAGRKNLDHHSQSVYGSAGWAAGPFALEGRLRECRTTFTDQRIVDGTGVLGEGRREDWLTSVSLAARMPADRNTGRRLLGSVDLQTTLNRSDQASYDARRARYLPGFYDYAELKTGLGGQWLLGDSRRPTVVDARLGWTRRAYPHRPPQDSTGNYLPGELSQDVRSVSAGVTHPLAPRFDLLFRWERAQASSNQDYQQLYAYGYTVTNFLFGVSYEY